MIIWMKEGREMFHEAKWWLIGQEAHSFSGLIDIYNFDSYFDWPKSIPLYWPVAAGVLN